MQKLKDGIIEKANLEDIESMGDVVKGTLYLIIQYLRDNPGTKKMYLKNPDGSVSAFTKIQIADGTSVDLSDLVDCIID